MARSFYIIDGYNLMHAAGMARDKYGPGDLARCRNRFLRHLANHLTASERERTTVAFDAGDAPPGAEREVDWEGMTVLFAPRGGDADSLIEELIASHSAPRQVKVVSSDHRLQKAARRRRGKTIDSDQFLDRLERRETAAADADRRRTADAPPGEKTTGLASPEETAEWMKVFGDIPEARQLQGEDAQWRSELEKWVRELDEADD